MFIVCKVDGKRITKMDRTKIVAMSGNPINLNIITSECDFDKSVSYPYNFTLLIANAQHGAAGEGEFEFGVYAMDPSLQVEELPMPDQ